MQDQWGFDVNVFKIMLDDKFSVSRSMFPQGYFFFFFLFSEK